MKTYHIRDRVGYGSVNARQMRLYSCAKKLGLRVAMDVFGQTHLITPGPAPAYVPNTRELFEELFRRSHPTSQAPMKKTIIAVSLAAQLAASGSEWGVRWSAQPVPIGTNSAGIVRAYVAPATQAFWNEWRTNKAAIKDAGYGCRPGTNGWQVIKIVGRSK